MARHYSAPVMVVLAVLAVGGVSQADEVASRLLVTSGVCEPLDSSPAGLALFYNETGGYAGICGIESGVEYKPLVLLNSKVGVNQVNPQAALHISRDAQSPVYSYGQVRVTTVTGITSQGLAVGISQGKAFLQAEEPGESFLPLLLNPSGGQVVARQGVTLKAPDGHCAIVSLANDNSLTVTITTCP